MGIDLNRVATKALETALEDGPSRHKGHTMRTLAAGAALAVGARAAVSKKPGKLTLLKHLPDVAKLREMPDRIRDRMADAGWLDDEPAVDDELEPQDEFDLEEPVDEEEVDDEDDFEDEPEDEGDEDFEDEPEDEGDEDFEDEPEDEGDEDFDDEDDLEDEDEFEDDEESDAPELEIESEDDEDLHPEDRPPKPPRSKAKSGR